MISAPYAGFYYRNESRSPSWQRATRRPAQTSDLLQHYLEQKAARGHSFSLVDHLRWDLRAIFRLAGQDRLLGSNPAEILFTPRTLTPDPIACTSSTDTLGPRPSREVTDFVGFGSTAT
jgi:hypothetical protein